MNYENYYLNLNKINEIESIEERSRIHEFYREMLFASHENRNEMATSFFNTLLKNNFLISIREENIDEILK